MKPDLNNIQIIIDQIIAITNPIKIILFGSIARGVANKNSDIDLLIVLPEGIHRRKTAQLLYQKIDSHGFSFDIIIATQNDLDKHKDNIGLIYKKIIEEGIEVYAA